MSDAVEDWLCQRVEDKCPSILAEGCVIGRWKVRGLLGRGGSSELYRVDDSVTGEAAALKLAKKTDGVTAARFERERMVLSAGLGVHFPRFFEAGVHDGHPFAVMELLHARDELPRGDASVAEYGLQICAALNCLHEYGFVHRDVKPGNVMFRTAADGRECAVLIDFGLASPCRRRPCADGAEEISVVDGKRVGVGTPGYAAPEQFIGGDVSPMMDIHGFGVLVSRCFSGNVPRCWQGIVNRSTSSIPGQRYTTVAELEKAIRRRHLPFRMTVGGVVAAGLCALIAFHEGAGISSAVDYEKESMEGCVETMPGYPPELAAKNPEKDAVLKIEGMLKRARNMRRYFVSRGITDGAVCLPDFANSRDYYLLTPELREKYGPIVTNLYQEIMRDYQAGRCGRAMYLNVCRLLY